MRPNEVVHRFLASIGRPAEAEQYLRFFQSEEPERFALVVVHDDVFKSAANALRTDLRFLRQLDLTPVLCVGSEALRKTFLEHLPDQVSARACSLEEVRETIAAGDLPTILAEDAEQRNQAVQTLAPRKIVHLVARSGLQPVGKKVRSLVDLSRDFDELMRTLPPEQCVLLREIQQLFDGASTRLTVSVTSPFDLLRELFTVRGAGTLVRRGATVSRSGSYEALDMGRLTELLRSAFGRQPVPDFFDRKVSGIYIAGDFQGAAVVEDRSPAPYLSKFAVDTRARGEGIGGDLWRALCADHERFFWRSRPSNPIAPWYTSHCDGLMRRGEWTVFWRGLAPSEIEAAIESATSAPIDFEANS